jgi:hypothetical protein
MRPFRFLVASLLLVPAAGAQVRQGLQELNGSGAFTSFEGGSSLFLDLSYGYFVTRSVEIGPSVQISRESRDDDFSSTAGFIGGFGHLHFGRRGATSVPFIGLEIDAGVGDAEGVFFGVVGGGKFFVAPGAALVPAVFFEFDDEGNSAFGGRFGVSAFF